MKNAVSVYFNCDLKIATKTFCTETLKLLYEFIKFKNRKLFISSLKLEANKSFNSYISAFLFFYSNIDLQQFVYVSDRD